MRFATVCSGIGAPEVAWSHLGWEHAFCSEIDPFASAVLAHRFPSVPNLGDLTKIGAERGPVDLLCGGTPCQSFSVAGRRAGLDDPRGVLAFEFLRLAGRLRAEWVVWENVPGVLSIDGGRAFGAFLGALVELGYGFAYRVLDAQWFGLAQRRARVFVVARLGDWRGPVAVLLEPEGLRGDPAPGREAGEGVAPTLANRARGGGGLGTDAECDGALIAAAVPSDHNIGARRDHESFLVAHPHRADGFDASEDGTGRGAPLVVAETLVQGGRETGPHGALDGRNLVVQDSQSGVRLKDTAGSLRADAPGSQPTGSLLLAATLTQGAESQGKGGYAGRRREDDENLVVGAPDGTVTALCARDAKSHKSGDGLVIGAFAHQSGGDCRMGFTPDSPALQRSQTVAVLERSRVRRFTPRECERLQGFPDDWTLVPYRGKPAKDGPRYRAVGNAMAVPVVRWIGERIALFEEATR